MQKLYIKVPSLTDKRINTLTRLAVLNRGETPIIVFDASTRKYQALKGAYIDTDERVIERISEMFSKENVILK